MIPVYVLVVALYSAGFMNPIPPMADLESCERVREAITAEVIRKTSKCVQVMIPAPSNDAQYFMNKKK